MVLAQGHTKIVLHKLAAWYKGKLFVQMEAAKILSLNAFSLMSVIRINHLSVLVFPVFVLDQELNVHNLLLRAVEEPSLCVQMEIVAQIVRRAPTILVHP